MHFKFITLLAAIVAPLAVSCTCPPRNPDGFKAGDELKQWFTDAVEDFFPFRDGWEDGYDKHFSRDLTATFNATWYDFDGLRGFYKNRANPILQHAFNGTFQYGFSGVVAVPFLGTVRGGWVYATVWEFGYRWGNPDLPWNVTLGAFGLVEEEHDCHLRFSEWREAGNLGHI